MVHKRRERGLTREQEDILLYGLRGGHFATENEIEDTEWRLKWITWWDENNPTGEGYTQLGILFQWVRVTNDKGKVMGTFYLKQADDGLVELFLVTPRKGLPPNPYDATFLSRVRWKSEDVDMREKFGMDAKQHYEYLKSLTPERIDAMEDEAIKRAQKEGQDDWVVEHVREEYKILRAEYANPEEVLDSRRSWRDAATVLGQSGLWDAHRNDGQRPVMGVTPIPAKDEDTRFKFHAGADSFTVRGSILGKILLGFRRAGQQHVPMDLVKRAIRHVN